MKRILTTLFTLAIIMAGSVPALAAGEETSTGQSVIFYPISVEEYTYGEAEEPRINKVYQLSLSDDPLRHSHRGLRAQWPPVLSTGHDSEK